MHSITIPLYRDFKGNAAVRVSNSEHINQPEGVAEAQLGPRLRKLHSRIEKARQQTEGMVFSRKSLKAEATPLQIAALLRSLAPAYNLLEDLAPYLATSLGSTEMPWGSLRRSENLDNDIKLLSIIGQTPRSEALNQWLALIKELAATAPHRLFAHVYVRYGGDLSEGQQTGEKAVEILNRSGFESPSFWKFDKSVSELKQQLHDGIEQLALTDQEENELVDESENAFYITQNLVAELANV